MSDAWLSEVTTLSFFFFGGAIFPNFQLKMGAAQAIARVREKESQIRELEATVADLEIQREEHRKLALVAQAEKDNLARQSIVVRTEQARDRELRVLASGQSDVDRAYMESEFAKARAAEHAAQAELNELKSKHQLLTLVCGVHVSKSRVTQLCSVSARVT